MGISGLIWVPVDFIWVHKAHKGIIGVHLGIDEFGCDIIGAH